MEEGGGEVVGIAGVGDGEAEGLGFTGAGGWVLADSGFANGLG